MDINQIIAKVLAGKASQEELEALNIWKQEAKDNIKAIQEMKAIDTVMSDLGDYKSYDVEDAWSKVKPNIEVETQTQTTKIVKLPWLRTAAAACGILLLSLIGWQWSSMDYDQISESTYVSTQKVLDATLDDGSVVKLDKNTTLTSAASRSVELDGKAYFDIAKSKTSQFVVGLPQGKVTVLGTKFTIDTRNHTTIIYVSEGTVRYDYGKRKVTLHAGDKLTLSDGDLVKVKSDGENINFWMLHKLSFRNESLTSVVRTLNKHYDKKVVIDDIGKANKCMVNTTIQDESIDEILSELAKTLGLKFHLIDGTLHIVESNC